MRFKRIYIEISSCCNLNCRMCPGWSRKKEFMSPARFEEILNKIHTYTPSIYLHVMGEPLFHPDLDEILSVADNYGLDVNVVTNGSLIRKAGDTLFAHESVRQVNFSVHALWEGGIEMDAEEYLGSLFDFADKAKKEGRPIITYRVWTNGNDIQKDTVGKILAHYGLPADAPEKKGRYKGIILADKIFLNGDDEFVWPDAKRIPTLTDADRDREKFCYGMRTQCGILVDGTVVPCCLDSEGTVALGNILTEQMEDILASQRAQAIYDGFTNHKAVEPLCQTCGFNAFG